MKYLYRKNRNKKGFTLVELIVVIAIIGVLAAIIIPTMMGYIQKANKANDKVMGKRIYEDVMNMLTEDHDAVLAFRKIRKGSMTVFMATNDGYNEDPTKWVGKNTKDGANDYAVAIVARMDGASNTQDKNAQYWWEKGITEAEEFVGRLNYKIGVWDFNGNKTDEAVKNAGKAWYYPMKLISHQENEVMPPQKDYSTDRWLLCYRLNNPDAVEIWTGYSWGKGRSGPMYRIYPDPCPEYD